MRQSTAITRPLAECFPVTLPPVSRKACVEGAPPGLSMLGGGLRRSLPHFLMHVHMDCKWAALLLHRQQG